MAKKKEDIEKTLAVKTAIRFTPRIWKMLEAEAAQLSESNPIGRVIVSDVIRLAVVDYFKRKGE